MTASLIQRPRAATPPLALTPQQREVLGLRFDPQGRTYRTRQQTATRLGCSQSRVTAVELRALHRLRALGRAVAAGHELPAAQAADWRRFRAVLADERP